MFHSRIFNHPQVVNSPFINDHGNIEDNKKVKVIKTKSY